MAFEFYGQKFIKKIVLKLILTLDLCFGAISRTICDIAHISLPNSEENIIQACVLIAESAVCESDVVMNSAQNQPLLMLRPYLVWDIQSTPAL